MKVPRAEAQEKEDFVRGKMWSSAGKVTAKEIQEVLRRLFPTGISPKTIARIRAEVVSEFYRNEPELLKAKEEGARAKAVRELLFQSRAS